MYRRRDMPSSSSQANNDIHPRTVLEIYWDFRFRRLGFLRAFSIDFDSFYSACDTDMFRLCAYAYPNGSWEVIPRSENLPSQFPEPRLGINLDRHLLERPTWLLRVASDSDDWLESLAIFFSAHLSPHDRNGLLHRMNDLPTLLEEVRLLNSI